MRQAVSQRESRALGESPVAVNGQARGFGARNQVWGDNVAEIRRGKRHLGATFHVLSAIGAIASFQTPGGAPRTSKKHTLKCITEFNHRDIGCGENDVVDLFECVTLIL